MKHRIVSLTGLEELPPEAAYQACLEAARRIEGMSDPIAFAALVLAEAGHSHERRLSGLGGEVARGFYYFGSMTPAPVTMARTARLAEWRMFANESVSREALVPEFSQWAKEFTVEEIFRILSGSGLDWIPATDEFYLAERMQRWAGVVDTAICFDRVVVNPMLDRRFLDIARGLNPADKSGARFLGRLQVELDPELARIPLDGRPAPYVFADPDALNRARITATAGRKALRKVGQRLSRSRRAPAGGDILAGKVVQHWQAFPQALDPIRELDVYQGKWLDDVLAGEVRPAPSSVALLVNLLAATG
jgi:asparagine synthase (glutamine-hydrolysing)